MGACVSSLHESSSMKVQISSRSNRKPDNYVAIPPSPVKEKLPIINGDVAVKPQLPPIHSTADFREFGTVFVRSKEETFFDSQAWLDSDCESDFMSVNGEFTPSRGNTPVHRNFSAATPPIKKSKRLSELFSESLRENRNYDEENGESADGNGVVGKLEAVGVPGGSIKPKRESWVEVVGSHGCLPRVLSSCRPVTHQQTEARKK
ncbi:hypothetical protein SSX86_018855 [Deinandra increscens subsp. villosa]|uniref:Uncharacterized protein n=1 Tax=Deinandra increscens subsp. villosa TaxID=3103831 RepID=A0AAP0CWP7_9ASTR